MPFVHVYGVFFERILCLGRQFRGGHIEPHLQFRGHIGKSFLRWTFLDERRAQPQEQGKEQEEEGAAHGAVAQQGTGQGSGSSCDPFIVGRWPGIRRRMFWRSPLLQGPQRLLEPAWDPNTMFTLTKLTLPMDPVLHTLPEYLENTSNTIPSPNI